MGALYTLGISAPLSISGIVLGGDRRKNVVEHHSDERPISSVLQNEAQRCAFTPTNRGRHIGEQPPTSFHISVSDRCPCLFVLISMNRRLFGDTAEKVVVDVQHHRDVSIQISNLHRMQPRFLNVILTCCQLTIGA
jgi:hypothetical protein